MSELAHETKWIILQGKGAIFMEALLHTFVTSIVIG